MYVKCEPCGLLWISEERSPETENTREKIGKTLKIQALLKHV
jgi:hypothetical protein